MSESIVYKTSLDYPKQFRLRQRPPRRPSTEPVVLKPLEPGDYVTLPLWNGSTNENSTIPHPTYRVVEIDESFNIELEIVTFRIGEAIETKGDCLEILSQKKVKLEQCLAAGRPKNQYDVAAILMGAGWTFEEIAAVLGVYRNGEKLP